MTDLAFRIDNIAPGGSHDLCEALKSDGLELEGFEAPDAGSTTMPMFRANEERATTCEPSDATADLVIDWGWDGTHDLPEGTQTGMANAVSAYVTEACRCASEYPEATLGELDIMAWEGMRSETWGPYPDTYPAPEKDRAGIPAGSYFQAKIAPGDAYDVEKHLYDRGSAATQGGSFLIKHDSKAGGEPSYEIASIQPNEDEGWDISGAKAEMDDGRIAGISDALDHGCLSGFPTATRILMEEFGVKAGDEVTYLADWAPYLEEVESDADLEDEFLEVANGASKELEKEDCGAGR